MKLEDRSQIQPFLKGGGPLTDDEVKKLIPMVRLSGELESD